MLRDIYRRPEGWSTGGISSGALARHLFPALEAAARRSWISSSSETPSFQALRTSNLGDLYRWHQHGAKPTAKKAIREHREGTRVWAHQALLQVLHGSTVAVQPGQLSLPALRGNQPDLIPDQLQTYPLPTRYIDPKTLTGSLTTKFLPAHQITLWRACGGSILPVVRVSRLRTPEAASVAPTWTPCSLTKARKLLIASADDTAGLLLRNLV